MSRPFFLLVAFAVLCVVVGCKPKPLPTVGSAAPKIVETGPPVSEKEAEEYGRKVAAAFNAKDADALATLIQVDELCLRSVSDFNLTAGERKSVADGLRTAGGAGRMCKGWMSQMEGSEVKLLRTRTKDGRRSLLLRVYGEDTGLNYLEFILVRGANGLVTTEDVYIYAVGETLTQVVRRVLLASLPKKNGGLGQYQLYQGHMNAIRQMQEFVRAGEPAKGKAIFDRLPAALRDEKSIHIQGLRASQGDDAVYLRELERYRQKHPNDPSLELVEIDYYLLKKDGKGLRESLWRLDASVGGDPVLRVYEANFQHTQGNNEEARRLAGEAIDLESSLAPAYWVLINVSLAEGEHAETLRLLKAVVEKCSFPLDVMGLKGEDPYKGFVASPQYKELCEWMAKRAK